MKLFSGAVSFGIFFSLTSVAKETTEISIKYTFSRFGVALCDDKKIVKQGELTLLCESVSGDNRIFVKASTKTGADRSILVTASLEEITPEGRIEIIGKPSIQTLVGEQAEISVAEDSSELFSFGVTPIL